MNNQRKDSDREGKFSGSELERLKFRLEIKKILLDKLILAIILGILAYLGNAQLERFKNNLASDQFYQEKKFVATMELKKAYSELSDMTMNMLVNRISKDSAHVKAALIRFNQVLRERSLYYNAEELLAFSACVWNYDGLAQTPVNEWGDYSDYFQAVMTNFRFLCRKTLGFEADRDYFEFVGVPNDLYGHVIPKDFLRNNLKKFQQGNK